jgi:hypothetical protein
MIITKGLGLPQLRKGIGGWKPRSTVLVATSRPTAGNHIPIRVHAKPGYELRGHPPIRRTTPIVIIPPTLISENNMTPRLPSSMVPILACVICRSNVLWQHI